MAKGAYIGVGGKAKKVKKIYIGVGGVARKVKKAYIGVGGVAKLWYSSQFENIAHYRNDAAPLSGYASAIEENSKYAVLFTKDRVKGYDGSLTTVITNRANYNNTSDDYPLSAAHIGNYAVFLGCNHSYNNNMSDASMRSVNNSMVITDMAAIDTRPVEQQNLQGGQLPSYILFNRCEWRNYVTNYKIIPYNASLTKMNAVVVPGYLGSRTASVGNYAYFSPSSSSANGLDYHRMWCVNNSLTAAETTNASFSNAERSVSGSNGAYAIFTGHLKSYGEEPVYSSNVDYYNTSGTRSGYKTLSVSRAHGFGISSEGLFAYVGGYNSSVYSVYNVIDAFDTKMTISTSTASSTLESAHNNPNDTATIGEYGICANVGSSSNYLINKVKIFKFS